MTKTFTMEELLRINSEHNELWAKLAEIVGLMQKFKHPTIAAYGTHGPWYLEDISVINSDYKRIGVEIYTHCCGSLETALLNIETAWLEVADPEPLIKQYCFALNEANELAEKQQVEKEKQDKEAADRKKLAELLAMYGNPQEGK